MFLTGCVAAALEGSSVGCDVCKRTITIYNAPTVAGESENY